jgi:hypothetical protein
VRPRSSPFAGHLSRQEHDVFLRAADGRGFDSTGVRRRPRRDRESSTSTHQRYSTAAVFYFRGRTSELPGRGYFCCSSTAGADRVPARVPSSRGRSSDPENGGRRKDSAFVESQHAPVHFVRGGVGGRPDWFVAEGVASVRVSEAMGKRHARGAALSAGCGCRFCQPEACRSCARHGVAPVVRLTGATGFDAAVERAPVGLLGGNQGTGGPARLAAISMAEEPGPRHVPAACQEYDFSRAPRATIAEDSRRDRRAVRAGD